MTPCVVIWFPHNYRDSLYWDDPLAPPTGDDDAEYPPRVGEYLDLPIPMPERCMVFTDSDGAPLAIMIEGKQVRWKDVPQVWQGICQYNDDCERADNGPL
jgi:hypothetical protein